MDGEAMQRVTTKMSPKCKLLTQMKGENMAQVELPKGIAAIHGRLGDFIYRSRKQADGTYKVYAHYSPKKAKVSAKR